MKTESFTKKYITKPLAGAIATYMISMPFTTTSANADSYLKFNRDMNEKRVELGFTISHDLFGGNSAKYTSRNKNLEAQVAGLASAPKISGETSQPSYKVSTGDYAGITEFGKGLGSVVTPYWEKTDGTNKIAPGWLSIDEGSVPGVFYGIIASAINGGSKAINWAFETELGQVDNPYQANFKRHAGVTVTVAAIIAGLIAANSGGSRSSDGRSSNNNNTSTPADDTSTPADSGEDGGDIIGPGGSGK